MVCCSYLGCADTQHARGGAQRATHPLPARPRSKSDFPGRPGRSKQLCPRNGSKTSCPGKTRLPPSLEPSLDARPQPQPGALAREQPAAPATAKPALQSPLSRRQQGMETSKRRGLRRIRRPRRDLLADVIGGETAGRGFLSGCGREAERLPTLGSAEGPARPAHSHRARGWPYAPTTARRTIGCGKGRAGRRRQILLQKSKGGPGSPNSL